MGTQQGMGLRHAALQGSSFYKLPRSCSGSPGTSAFHHIHHLSRAFPIITSRGATGGAVVSDRSAGDTASRV